jgi:transposase
MSVVAGQKPLTAAATAQIVRESQETARRWIKRSLAEGLEGFQDRLRSGAPPKVTDAYRERVLQVVPQRPRSLGQLSSLGTLQPLADYLAEQTEIHVEDETIPLQ